MAGCFALAAFSVAIISGLGVGRDTTEIIEVALIALVLGQLAGIGFGHLIRAALREQLVAFESAHPIPADTTMNNGTDPASQQAPTSVEGSESGAGLEAGA